MVLVAMKADMESERQVTTEQGQEMANWIGAKQFFECSAKTQQGLKKVFVETARCALAEQGKSTVAEPGHHTRKRRCDLL